MLHIGYKSLADKLLFFNVFQSPQTAAIELFKTKNKITVKIPPKKVEKDKDHLMICNQYVT